MNKSTKKILYYLLTCLIILFSGCKKESDVTNIVEDGPITGDVNPYFPLKTGNKWYYNHYLGNLAFDSTNANEIHEIVGTKKFNNKLFYEMKYTYLNQENNLPVESKTYYFCKNDTLYEYYSSTYSDTPDHLEICAIFSLNKGDKFFVKRNSDDYEVTITEKTENIITFYWDNPQSRDEERAVTYKKNTGIFERVSFGFGDRSKLIKAVLQ